MIDRCLMYSDGGSARERARQESECCDMTWLCAATTGVVSKLVSCLSSLGCISHLLRPAPRDSRNGRPHGYKLLPVFDHQCVGGDSRVQVSRTSEQQSLVAVVFAEDGSKAKVQTLKYDEEKTEWTTLAANVIANEDEKPLRVRLESCFVQLDGNRAFIVETKGKAYLSDNLSAAKWSRVDDVPSQRRCYGASGIQRGDVVYVVGGSSDKAGKKAIDVVMRFNVREKTWLSPVKWPRPTCRPAVALCSERILVIGGADSNGQQLNEIQYLDSNEKWFRQRLYSLMTSRRHSRAPNRVPADTTIVSLRQGVFQVTCPRSRTAERKFQLHWMGPSFGQHGTAAVFRGHIVTSHLGHTRILHSTRNVSSLPDLPLPSHETRSFVIVTEKFSPISQQLVRPVSERTPEGRTEDAGRCQVGTGRQQMVSGRDCPPWDINQEFIRDPKDLSHSTSVRIFKEKHRSSGVVRLGREYDLSSLTAEEARQAHEALKKLQATLLSIGLNYIQKVEEGDTTLTIFCDFYSEPSLEKQLHDAETEKEAFEEDEVVHILQDAIRTLRKLHQSGIVHGNITPSCVIRDDKGVVQLVDIRIGGLHKRQDTKLTFAAPEVRHGEQPTMASDIWSLGAVAYRMLAGKDPPERTNTKHLFPRGGKTLKKLVKKMLQHDPIERPNADRVLKCLSEPSDITQLARSWKSQLSKVGRTISNGVVKPFSLPRAKSTTSTQRTPCPKARLSRHNRSLREPLASTVVSLSHGGYRVSCLDSLHTPSATKL